MNHVGGVNLFTHSKLIQIIIKLFSGNSKPSSDSDSNNDSEAERRERREGDFPFSGLEANRNSSTGGDNKRLHVQFRARAHALQPSEMGDKQNHGRRMLDENATRCLECISARFMTSNMSIKKFHGTRSNFMKRSILLQKCEVTQPQ